MSVKHYEDAAVTVTLEPIYICEQTDFLTGSLIKYVCRYPYKGQPEADLKKAIDYARRIISKLDAAQVTEYRPFRDKFISVMPAFCNKHPLLRILFYNPALQVQVIGRDRLQQFIKAAESRLKEIALSKS